MYAVDIQSDMSQWGMVEEKRICAMYAVGTFTETCLQAGWGRRVGSQPCKQ